MKPVRCLLACFCAVYAPRPSSHGIRCLRPTHPHGTARQTISRFSDRRMTTPSSASRRHRLDQAFTAGSNVFAWPRRAAIIAMRRSRQPLGTLRPLGTPAVHPPVHWQLCCPRHPGHQEPRGPWMTAAMVMAPQTLRLVSELPLGALIYGIRKMQTESQAFASMALTVRLTPHHTPALARPPESRAGLVQRRRGSCAGTDVPMRTRAVGQLPRGFWVRAAIPRAARPTLGPALRSSGGISNTWRPTWNIEHW